MGVAGLTTASKKNEWMAISSTSSIKGRKETNQTGVGLEATTKRSTVL